MKTKVVYRSTVSRIEYNLSYIENPEPPGEISLYGWTLMTSTCMNIPNIYNCVYIVHSWQGEVTND